LDLGLVEPRSGSEARPGSEVRGGLPKNDWRQRVILACHSCASYVPARRGLLRQDSVFGSNIDQHFIFQMAVAPLEFA
jgi:ribosomal protein S6E (S10)